LRLPLNLAPPDWLPPCTTPISLHHGLQILLQTQLIMASEFISNLAWSWAGSESRS